MGKLRPGLAHRAVSSGQSSSHTVEENFGIRPGVELGVLKFSVNTATTQRHQAQQTFCSAWSQGLSTSPVQQECCRPSGREPPPWGDTRAPCSAQCPLPRQTEACADQVSNIKQALQAPFFMLWRAPWLSGRIVCSFVSERLPCERMPGRWH